MGKKALIITTITGSLIGLWFLFYLIFLPKVVTSAPAIKYMQAMVTKYTGCTLSIEQPTIETKLKPEVELEIGRLNLTKDGKQIVQLEDFELEIGFGKIFSREIKLDELSVKNLVINANNLLEIIPNELNSTPTASDEWKFDCREAELEVENGLITYNNSKIFLSSQVQGAKMEISAKSDNIFVADIFELVNSNRFIPNGKEMLTPLIAPSGAVSMDIGIKNDGLHGKITMKNAKASIKDLNKLPLVMPSGTISIHPDKLIFSDFNGYYGKNKTNSVKINGTIKDYYKTFNSDITIDTIATNEFLTDYLASLTGGIAIQVSQDIPTRLVYKAINNKMSIIWLAKIAKGVSFGIDNTPSPLNDYDRAIKGEFFIDGNDLNIKNINYYIAKDIYKGMAKIDPILIFDGKMNIMTGELHEAGFSFGKELPSEFLNVFLPEKMFKGGTVKGDLHILFKDNIPKVKADMQIAKTRIPSQRLYIKNATLNTNKDDIKITANGRFKRIKYDVSGKIKNEMITPIVIRDLDLNLDKVDVDKLLKSLNNRQITNNTLTANSEMTVQTSDDEDILDDDFMFDTNLLVIEDCVFRLKEGVYNGLNFGNIEAQMTLDRNGIFNLQSNKFDIAEGISTLKVNCDLTNQKYYLRLGVKDVNSDTFSTALLNLSKEISGKASGLIELTSDATMKMNGTIKFLISDGTIGKIGLVEYLMKVASVFRNPIAMISPGTIMDIINVPEGRFDRIQGELAIKDNVIQRMDIKSFSPTLSALIRGRYDIEKSDASIRIYTRFSSRHKGFAGFLRNLSLNTLANKVKLSGRNDANYYASELVDLPAIDAKDDDTQIFLTQVEGDVEHNNFLSGLKKIK